MAGVGFTAFRTKGADLPVDLRLLGMGGKGLLSLVRSAARKAGLQTPNIEAFVTTLAQARLEAALLAAERWALQLAQAAAVASHTKKLQKNIDTVPHDTS